MHDNNVTTKGIIRTCALRSGFYLLLRKKRIIFAESIVREGRYYFIISTIIITATNNCNGYISVIGYKAKANIDRVLSIRGLEYAVGQEKCA